MPVFIAEDKPRGASGIGVTLDDAWRRARGEAVELASLWWWGDEQTVVAHAADLDAPSVSPEEILLYHAEQYADRDAWNERLSPWEQVPEVRDPGAEIHWIRATDLSGAPVWLPAACCFLAFPFSAQTSWAIADSNGCAAARTRDEAIAAAVFECVEREALAIWWHHAVRRPAIGVSGSLPGALQPLWTWLESRERRHHVLDLRTDIGIPVMAAVASDPDGTRIAYGFGAHLDPHAALESALLEMLQDELMLRMMGPGEEERWRQQLSFATLPHLAPGEQTTPLDSLQAGVSGSSLSQLATLCERCDLRPVVLDLTRSAIGVPVVRVVVPGMRHFRLSLAPGRLYEVPRKLGWPARSYQEISDKALIFLA